MIMDEVASRDEWRAFGRRSYHDGSGEYYYSFMNAYGGEWFAPPQTVGAPTEY